MSISKRSSTLLTGIITGLIGGLVEFGWVTLYADITGADPHQFAPGIVSATGVRALLPGRPPSLLSIPVNLSFAVVLGIVLTFAWRAIRARRPDLTNPLPFALAALAVVWAINFFVVLPIVRPEFVHLVPYSVSLTSSLLFGAAVAAVLYDNLAFSSGIEHSDGVVRQGPDTRQCRRTVRRAVCRAHPSRAKRGFEPHCNRSRCDKACRRPGV